MGQPFSEHVANEPWRREAETWIAEQLAAADHQIIGVVEQRRIRPWSTQLVVPTDVGQMWFKANCPSMAFEPLLHAELGRLAPDAVDAPFAIDAARGWMLTVDRGATLGDGTEPSVDDWRQLLAEAAGIQRILSAHREELLATGLPDCSPATVPERFDRTVDTFEQLPDEHPSYVSPDLAVQLRKSRPAIVDAAQALAESSHLPSSRFVTKCTVSPTKAGQIVTNLEEGAGLLRIFDFGDAQWAHAAEVLSVPYGWITSRTQLSWSDVVGAYCDEWNLAPDDLTLQWDATALTQPVNRALTWWACLTDATAAEWLEWGDTPIHHLTRLLET